MKKRFISAAVTAALVGGLAAGSAQAGPGGVKFTTKDGILFKFGISTEVIQVWNHNIDLDDNTDDGAIVNGSFGDQADDDRTGSFNAETRLMFTAEKDRLSIYTMIEWDGKLDEQQIDHNNPNIERINISLKLPEMNSTFSVGADLIFFDTVGRLVYLDDDPMILLKGGRDNMTWQFGYNKRRENDNRGDSGARFGSVGDEGDHDLLHGRLGFKGKTAGGSSWYLEPFLLYQNRNRPVAGAASQAYSQEQNAAYLGLGGTFQAGMFKLAGQIVHHRGDVTGTTDPTTGTSPFGRDDFDIRSWAAHAHIAANLSKTGWALGGVSPYVSWDWGSGDDDATDGDLEGFVAVTTPNSLRHDGGAFTRRSVAEESLLAVGNGSSTFGFETARLGTGPTVGQISELGRGDSGGFHRIALGMKGKLNKKWSLNTRIIHLRFSDTDGGVNAAVGSAVDDEIGTGFDINFEYRPQPTYTIAPFFSMFFPGDGAEDIIGDDATGVKGGIEFNARF